MAERFPTKPRLKPLSKTLSKTPESHYWTGFKSPLPDLLPNLKYPITSLTFSPSNPNFLAATASNSLSLFNPHHPFSPLSEPVSTFTSFKDTSFSATYRSDGNLIAASSLSGSIHVFNPSARSKGIQLRLLKGGSPVRVVRFPGMDNLHLHSGGDDGVVKYWDVATESCLRGFVGHKDYIRGGCVGSVDDCLFFTGSYDGTVKMWDVRDGGRSNSSGVMSFDHGKPVESVVCLPSGGLVASAGGNVVKIWDVIGGGKCVFELEGHNKTVTSICVGKVGRNGGGLEEEYRLLSVSLDGYLKVFDFGKMKTSFSMRFPAPLLSVAFSSDGRTRAIGTSNGVIYIGKRKKETVGDDNDDGVVVGFGDEKRVLKPSNFRYFHRGQGEKPKEGDYVVSRKKKVKLAEHDKLLRKFRHKDAFLAVLSTKIPDKIVAVMEELVARKKLFKVVSNLDVEELSVLLGFLQKYTTMPRFAGLLMPFANKVIQMRSEDIRASDALKVHIRHLKSAMVQELMIQQSLLEIQGVISPLMKIAGRSS